jgi:hypothetical protein
MAAPASTPPRPLQASSPTHRRGGPEVVEHDAVAEAQLLAAVRRGASARHGRSGGGGGHGAVRLGERRARRGCEVQRRAARKDVVEQRQARERASLHEEAREAASKRNAPRRNIVGACRPTSPRCPCDNAKPAASQHAATSLTAVISSAIACWSIPAEERHMYAGRALGWHSARCCAAAEGERMRRGGVRTPPARAAPTRGAVRVQAR